ncbi:unnamed protein product, partial [Gulo gulo]
GARTHCSPGWGCSWALPAVGFPRHGLQLCSLSLPPGTAALTCRPLCAEWCAWDGAEVGENLHRSAATGVATDQPCRRLWLMSGVGVGRGWQVLGPLWASGRSGAETALCTCRIRRAAARMFTCGHF